MSPQSRGRKRKPGKAAKARTRRHSATGSPWPMLLRSFGPVAEADSLDVEIFASRMLGALHDPLASAPDSVFDLIAFLAGKRTGPALGLLLSIAQLGSSAEQRAEASAAADALRGPDVAALAACTRLADASLVETWQFADVYGDQATVLCVFERDGERHSLMVLVDFNEFGGSVKDISLSLEPDDIVRDMRRAQLRSGGVVRFGPLPAEQARWLVEDGIAATDMSVDADVGDDYRKFRALTLARCRAMPLGNRPEDAEFDDAQRAEFVDEFLRDCPLEKAAADSARYLARLMVDYGCDYDAGRPLRIGPGKLANFLLGFLPRKAVLDADDRAAVPDFARAWSRWAADRAELPDAARGELDSAVEEILEEFEDSYEEGSAASPTKAFLTGLPENAGINDVRDAVERRMFAMPYFGTRIGDEDYPRLDPNDEDELGLLVLGEHPEFHAALADPSFDGELDGVNPRLHLAVDEVVVRQLWTGDPPEVWAAAQRLRDAGLSRWEVIHEIAAVMVERIWHAMADEDVSHNEADYLDALNQLGRQARRGRGRRPAAGASGGVLQLKVSLRYAKPPIWRRLRVPATATLEDLHHVIQAAFGWTDSHLHLFEAGDLRYAARHTGLDDARPSDRVPIASVLAHIGATLRYEYDFGDSWEHDVVLEAAHPDDDVQHAVCVAGRRAGPVEDCGGVGGWEYLCEVLADPKHPEHDEQLEWLGYVPDPKAFDLDAVNRALARIPIKT